MIEMNLRYRNNWFILAAQGHRMVEIGCIELNDPMPTKESFHYYGNPRKKEFLMRHLKFMVTVMNFYLNKKIR